MKEKNENQYFISDDQREIICNHFGKDSSTLEWWEVMELLDEVIDSLVE